MNNDKLTQALRKVGEAASLFGEWCTEQLTTVIDAARNIMASYDISADKVVNMFKRQKRLEEKYKRIRNVPEDKSNNWLKAHGYPIRREIAGRHGRRKKHEISITENNKTSVECEGSEGRGRCEKSERAECTVQRSNSAGEFPAGSGSDQLQRDRRSHEPDRCEIHKPSTETGRMKRNQGGTARRRYSGGWPSRKK